jgi:integrase
LGETQRGSGREVAHMRQGGVSQLGGRRVRQFEKRHPVGSTARLAMALTLYTGMRRSDAVLLGPDHVKNGWIKFTPKKASGTTGKTLELPLLKVLDDVINASATGAETFLVTSQGTKWHRHVGT